MSTDKEQNKTRKQPLFGTDGIRGKSNEDPMSADIALRVAMAAGHYLHQKNKNKTDRRPKVIIAKDTRLSGYMIEPAMTAGFAAVGMDVFLLGPLPTPALSHLTHSMRCDLGVMISASHNPYHDNGIKLFDSDGFKLSDEAQNDIESLIHNGMKELRAKSEDLGRVTRMEDAQGRYIEFAKSTFPDDLRLRGLKIVVDCANGATYKVAPTVLWELGAEVISIGVSPNGFNINEKVGATAPEALCAKVLEEKADIGIALDGDGDRLIVVDEKGQVVDGDQLLGLITKDRMAAGTLTTPAVVGTVMTNLGLELWMKENGVTLHRAKVGDRYVLEMMRELGANIGGEQSGHIILRDYIETGDGLISALEVLAALKRSDVPASDLCRVFTPTPQILKNIRFKGNDPCTHETVLAAVTASESKLGDTGRIVLRKSGTEPVIRVMAEGEDHTLLEQVVNDIGTAIENVVNG